MMDHEPSNRRHKSSSHKSHHKKHSSSSSSSSRHSKPLKTPEDERGLKPSSQDEEWAPQSLQLKKKNTFNNHCRDRYGSANSCDYNSESTYSDDDDDDSFMNDVSGRSSGGGGMRDVFANSKAELNYNHHEDDDDDDDDDANYNAGNYGGGQTTKKCNNMFESFRHLEDALEKAKLESLNTCQGKQGAGGGMDAHKNMVQSFRNLELAMAEAQKNSLNDYNNRSNEGGKPSSSSGKKKSKNKKSKSKAKCSLYESFTNLDEATAQAIKASLSDKGKGLFESFRDLDGAMEQAKRNSLDFENQDLGFNPRGAGGGNRGKKNSVVASFSDLDEAMAQAMKNSLADAGGQGFGDDSDDDHRLAQILERLDEGEAEGGSEFSGSMRSSGRGGGGGGSGGSSFRASSSSITGLDDNETVRTAMTVNRRTQNMLDFKERRRSSQLSEDEDGNNCGGDNNEANNKNRPGVQNVDEPAPNLSRLARRHANRRFNDHQRAAREADPFALSSGDRLDGSEREEETTATDRHVSEPVISSNGTPRRGPGRRTLTRQDGSRAPSQMNEEPTRLAPRRHSSLTSCEMQASAEEASTDAGGGGRIRRRGSRRSNVNSRSSSEIDDVGPLLEAPVRDARTSLHYAPNRQESLSAGALAFEQEALRAKEKKAKKKSKEKKRSLL